MNPSRLEGLRAHFPHLDEKVYLNHAATGVYSKPVVEAIQRFVQERHDGDLEYWLPFLPTYHRAKERLATLLGTSPKHVAFTQNTTEGLSAVAQGFPWQAGDRIVIPGCEFPANVYPWLQLQAQGVHLDLVDHTDGVVTEEALLNAITPRTRMVAVSWVQFLSGAKLDLEQLADGIHARGGYLVVDGIQGVGALTLNVEETGIDFLAGGTQKWLMGVRGLGYLYASPRMMDVLTPRAGWLNIPTDWDDFFKYDLKFVEGAERFVLGTPSHMAIAGFDAALGLYLDADPAQCEPHILSLNKYLIQKLNALGYERYGTDDPSRESGVLTIRAPDPEGLFKHLLAQNVTISLRNRLLRFSPSWYNIEADLDRALEAVAAFPSA